MSNQVTINDVDMTQVQFDFAMDRVKESLEKFEMEEETVMAKYISDKFNEKFGGQWTTVVGDKFGLQPSYKGNFAYFHYVSKDFVIFQSC